MIKVQFVSSQTLKDNSVIQANADEKLLNIAIREFQELELKKLLGTTEYNRLQDVVLGSLTNANPIVPLSDSDAELLQYVKQWMIYGALMYSIPILHRKFTNTGIKEDDQLNSKSADMQQARGDYSFKADGFKRDLLDYIASQQTEQPLNTCQDPNDTTFSFTGMSLPDVTVDVQQIVDDQYFKNQGGYISL